jgi:monoterpene epsilon-lactone hydrolase
VPSESFRAYMRMMDKYKEIRDRYSQSLEDVRLAIKSFDGHFPLASDIKVEPVDAGGVNAEWVTSSESRSERVILYTHGGCYISGSPLTVRECCSRVARAAEAKVLSLDYRLAPEHPFPAALDDVIAAYTWLLESGYQARNIVISGESAGGGLTFAALMKIRDDARLPMPALGVPISPWIDMTLQHKSLKCNVSRDIASTVPLEIGARLYVGSSDPRGPYVSPLFGDLAGLPPLLIQVGGGEVLLDDGIAIAHEARRQGVDMTLEVWPEMVHVWHWYATELDEGREAIESIGEFIKRRLN